MSVTRDPWRGACPSVPQCVQQGAPNARTVSGSSQVRIFLQASFHSARYIFWRGVGDSGESSHQQSLNWAQRWEGWDDPTGSLRGFRKRSRGT